MTDERPALDGERASSEGEEKKRRESLLSE